MIIGPKYIFVLFSIVHATSVHAAESILLAVTDFEVGQTSAAFVNPYAESMNGGAGESGLAIDTVRYFDAPASAFTAFTGATGSYRLELLAVAEEDGESLYEIYVNGDLVAKRRAPITEAKREPTLLDFGSAILRPGDRIEVIFQGNTNLKILENGGYAWSRGRWRGLRMIPVEGSSSGRSGASTGRHVSLWSDVRIPSVESSDATVLNPYGERIKPRSVQNRDGSRSIAFVTDTLGQWTIVGGNETFIYQVDPGKFLGPLSVWTRKSGVLSSGNDRPLKLVGVTCSNPRQLLGSDAYRESIVGKLHHSPVNFVKFTDPLVGDPHFGDAVGEDAVVELLGRVEALFRAFREKSIYIWLSSPVVSQSVMAALPQEARSRVSDRIQDMILLHWNVFAPQVMRSMPEALKASISPGTRKLLDTPSIWEKSTPQVTLLTGSLDEQIETLSTASANRAAEYKNGASINGDSRSHAIRIGSGAYPDLAFDQSGAAHFVYAREGALYYRTRDSVTGELSAEIDTSLRYASTRDGPHRSDPEIEIDPEGRVHVMVGSHYAIRENGRWVELQTNFLRDTALALDSHGNAFICKRGGNHDGLLGIDMLPHGTDRFVPTAKDPDVGTAEGRTWSLGLNHPYGSVFVDRENTLYVVYRQGAPDFIAWRASRDQGATWFGGGVYGGDVWQGESPSGTADSLGNLFVVGPNGWLLVKRFDHDRFRAIGHAVDCWARDLPELAVLADERIAIASFGGRLAVLESGHITPEWRIASPDGKPIGFVNIATDRNTLDSFVVFESGDNINNESEAGVSEIWLMNLSDVLR